MNFGYWVGDVGYRIPNGKWLTRDFLDATGFKEMVALTSSNQKGSPKKGSTNLSPALLFLRERDLLQALNDAVQTEQEKKGTIQTHYAKSDRDGSTTVEDILGPKCETKDISGQLLFSDKSISPRDTPYNLILACDGMHSTLRFKYGNRHYKKWEQEDCRANGAIEDRQYSVFRGYSQLSNLKAGSDGTSFQTWGEEKSMRFAMVKMSHPTDKIAKQVWFATISDQAVTNTKNVLERKRLLLSRFKDWHHPICDLIRATPADKILIERAVAHKNIVYPVFNVNQTQRNRDGVIKSKKSGRERLNPVLLFLGDANMTIDPVLAQGFTIAMETAADLANTLEVSLGANTVFDAKKIQEGISMGAERQYIRTLCLLRATDLVQTLAQPQTNSFSGFLSKTFLRPAIQFTPVIIKKKIFSFVMKYSLGYYGGLKKRKL